MSQYHAWWQDEKALLYGALPEDLQNLLEENNPKFVKNLCNRVFEQSYSRQKWPDTFGWIWNLYLHPNPLAQEALKQLLKLSNYRQMTKLLKRYYYYSYQFQQGNKYSLIRDREAFRYMKAIYKLAEKRQDVEMWAVLAHRFDAGRSPWISKKTRHYLRRRTWRYLRKMGERGSADYVHFATNVLLLYDDQDGMTYKYFEPTERRWIPSYTRLWLMNHLLYHHSKRFNYRSSKYWQDQGVDSYPLVLPTEREEAFPGLWDQHPDQLFRLLNESTVDPIMQFAGRALRQGNPDFVRQLSQAQLNDMLDSNYSVRRSFAAGALLDRLDPDRPAFAVWFPLMFSNDPEVRLEAKQFVERYADRWSAEQVESLIFSCNQYLTEQGQVPNRLIQDLIEVFRSSLQSKISQLATMKLAQMFFRSPSTDLQVFAAFILSKISFEKSPFHAKELLPFLHSEHTAVYQAAEKLLVAHRAALQIDADWYVDWICASDEQHRPFILSYLQEEPKEWETFASQLTQKLWQYMLRSDGSEQVQAFILTDLMKGLLSEQLQSTSLDRILSLLEHQKTEYQEFAVDLIRLTQLDPDRLSFQHLLAMAHNRVAAVRAEARRLITAVPERVSADWLYNLVETDWTDTREWMFDYIRKLPLGRVTPELIYGLIDTARRDVQQFAMNLVEMHQDQLDMKELMLRGSEHPHLIVQEYVISLADRVTWDREVLQNMELFLRTVLLRVNQGRKAKKMALVWLQNLCMQSRDLAEVGVPILIDVARNQGARDFEKVLRILTQIKMKYPDMQMPFEMAME